MNVASPPPGILDPKQPWYNGKVGDRTWDSLKAKLTGGKDSSGTQYSSFVNLTNADADKLIKNLKKYGKYPQVNQTGGAGGYENLQKYQEWLVEEFLEKPFQQQTNQKIEDAAIESRLKEIQEQKKEKAQSFISGATSFRPGKKISAKTTSISNIIPKKTIPQEIAEKITSPSELGGGENEPVTNAPRGVITSLGRLTLNLEQSNNNLEKIIEVIKDDYKTTKETNKKEIEDYRKRVANRGRILGKKELGNDKVDLSGIIKKYVGSFFSGTGGAIRALAVLNLIEGIMTGDPGKILGSLTGITASYLPAIGMAIGGKVAENLGKRLFLGGGRRSGGGIVRGFGGIAREAKPISRLARGGGRLALGAGLAAGALAIGGKVFGGGGEAQRVSDITNPKQNGQGGADVLMPKDSLKRFDELNTKFEQAVNMLLSGGGDPGPGPGAGPMANPYDIPGLTIKPGSIGTLEQFKKILKGTPMEAESEAIYNTALSEGINPAFVAGLAGAESSFGSKGKAVGRNNPFNYGVYNNQTYPSYAEATKALARALRDPKGYYYGEGRKDIESILKRYAPPSDGNDNAAEMKNIMTIGGGTGGDPNAVFIPRGSIGGTTVPIPPASPTPAGITPAGPTPRNLPSPGSTAQQNIQPFPVASVANSPSSGTSDGSEGPPAISTTYYENFLALYSKLIYQIV